ncbi:uncharacterized protein LOC111404629 [Olea europaea var. sylvestris]|uniref:uncharacterized protein LOC111404629 n=1 Tax=Olea europaea var. sylvestris TaxID=158386 RepID=UPI000C1D545D|nr:uncharacterized protein LOC111404629 [Olea europaea var. sylvestris]
MGSPRAADCFDISNHSLIHKVSEEDNKLGIGKQFPGLNLKALNNPNLYAAEKEIYLGSLCHVSHAAKPWQFCMVLLKNGNYDTKSGLCPENGKKVPPFSPGRFPCFGSGCMNQPILYHQPTSLDGKDTMKGGFNCTYELDGNSYFEVAWEKKFGSGSWDFAHKLRTLKKYPWLMLYLRADATKGYSGGYHYDTRGMLKTLSIRNPSLIMSNLMLNFHFLFCEIWVLRIIHFEVDLTCEFSESSKLNFHTRSETSFSVAIVKVEFTYCIQKIGAGQEESNRKDFLELANPTV